MARQIDWSEPLSDEDRAWAEQRLDLQSTGGKTFRQLIEENDQEHGREAKLASQSRAERIQEIDTQLSELTNERQRLSLEQEAEERENAARSGTPEAGQGFVDNTYVDGEKPDGAAEPVQDYSDEKYWTKDRLTTEIEGRNQEREEAGLKPLAKSGTRSELIERLQQDDREAAEAEAQG